MLDRARPRRLLAVSILLAAVYWPVALPAQAADSAGDDTATKSVLILPFDMVDTSVQAEMNHGPLRSDTERLQRTEQIVRRAVDALPDFKVIPNKPVKSEIDNARNTYRYLYGCNGCDVDIGKMAHADLVMTGWVQKVSNLILNINATIRSTATGREVGGASVDMRNDTDKSWRSSALYLVSHPLLSNYHSRQQAPDSNANETGAPPARVPIRHYPG